MKALPALAGVIIPLLFVPHAASAQQLLFSTEGTLAPGDRTAPEGGFQDRYELSVPADSFIEVVVSSDDFDPFIAVEMPDGTTFSVDDYRGLDAGFTRDSGPGGTLAVRVSSLFPDERGSYRIRALRHPSPPLLAIGETVGGTIAPLDVQSFARPADRYTVRGTPGDRIVVDLTSADFDAFLELADGRGRVLTDDDGGGAGLNSRLSYQFEERGAVTITATSFDGSEGGSYELRVSAAPSDVRARIDGELGAGDERAYDGTRFDLHEIAAEAGDLVTILLESDDFDPVLYLARGDGSLIERNDDGGEGTDSMITATLPASGVYRLYVTGFLDGVGRYRLTVLE